MKVIWTEQAWERLLEIEPRRRLRQGRLRGADLRSNRELRHEVGETCRRTGLVGQPR